MLKSGQHGLILKKKGKKGKRKVKKNIKMYWTAFVLCGLFYLGHFGVLIDEAQHWHFQISIR